MTGRRVGIALVCCLLVGGVAGLAGAASQTSGFGLTVEDSLDLPDRTVTLEGQQFSVPAVAQADPGEELQVEATAPPNASVEVNLITAEKDVLASQRVTGPAALTFQTSSLDPGTYLLVLMHNGTPQAIHPVIVRGYTLRIESPTWARINTSINVTVEVTRTATPANLSRVELVFTGEGDTFRGTVPRIDQDTFRVRLPFPDHLSPGNYSLFAIAESERTLAFGRPVVLGVSGRQPLELRPSNTSVTLSTVTPQEGTVHTPSPRSGPDVITPNPTLNTTENGNRSGVADSWPWLLGGGVLIALGYLLLRRT